MWGLDSLGAGVAGATCGLKVRPAKQRLLPELHPAVCGLHRCGHALSLVADGAAELLEGMPGDVGMRPEGLGCVGEPGILAAEVAHHG